jgi:hypothetical protein
MSQLWKPTLHHKEIEIEHQNKLNFSKKKDLMIRLERNRAIKPTGKIRKVGVLALEVT